MKGNAHRRIDRPERIRLRQKVATTLSLDSLLDRHAHGAEVQSEGAGRGDGTVAVTNRCEMEDGNIDEARGVARSADSVSNSKLEVGFVNVLGKQLFCGDYWIIGLGADYDFALVGTPSRRWGWILACEPRPSRQRVESWLERLPEQGYDPKVFVRSDQSPREAEDVVR